MKRLKVFAIIMITILLFTIPNVSFAYDIDYCEYTENGDHDFSFISEKTNRHPHKGYRECICGERVYYDVSYFDECEKCRKELCEKDLHYYLAEIHYEDSHGYAGYGECYCGKQKSFSSTYIIEKTHYPYPGVISVFKNILLEEKHPHREYDEETGKYINNTSANLGDCGVCELENDYWEKLEEYDIQFTVYGDDYYDEDDYESDDAWYDEEFDYESEEYYYDYEEYDYYQYYELYEWLIHMKEFLTNQ